MEQPALAQPLKVDIVSDVVCPWCVIGYKQLMKGLASLQGQFDVSVHWHPFELNPQMTEAGEDLREYLTSKYGVGANGASSARSRLTALGETLGFTFDYHDGMRMVNTYRAHQLLHWAGTLDRQTELKLALFEAFFSRRENVNDSETLAKVVSRVGLDVDEARTVLSDERFAEAVRKEEEFWRVEHEVFAVPTFLFQQQYLVPGAQEAVTFVRVLQKIHAKEG